MTCDLCNGAGWIDTFNTNREVQEIQKCDNCNIYKTDEQAKESKNGKSITAKQSNTF